ncbi:THAP domain-containing protein 2-like [Temnothorax longispinosus]|uniref:THAP domain-containing protein 2-like n=1 Tax=Temnothorax longispinosus TaxID=300112 RepID=UPI003A9990AF
MDKGGKDSAGGEIDPSLGKFRFPKNDNKRQKWLEVLHLNNYNPPKYGAVCSAHFREVDYDTNNIRRTLKRNAVPFLGEEYACKIIRYTDDGKPEKLSEKNVVQNDGDDGEQMEIEEEMCNINFGRAHRSTSISPERVLNSPTKKLLEIRTRENALLKRKLAVSVYKQRIAVKNIHSLRDLLKGMSKKNLTPEKLSVLEDFDPAAGS